MSKKLFLLLLLGSIGTTPAIAQEMETTIQLYAGQVKILPTEPVKRVAVGNGKLISTTVVDGRELLMLAESPGETSLHLWYKDGSEGAYRVLIAPANAGRAAAEIQSLLDRSQQRQVSVHIVGDHVVLDGKDLPADLLKRITALGTLYPKTIILAQPETVHMEKMVWLDVKILEMKKTALENYGVDWSKGMAGPQLGIAGDIIHNDYFRLDQNGAFQFPQATTQGLPLNVPPFAVNFGLVSSIASRINFALSNGDAYQIANPKLSAKSGGKTTFLAGGQVPIPLAIGFGQTTVEFKDYGVKLEFQPVADERGNVNMHVLAEVSEIDPASGVQSNGLTIPGFLTRKSDAEINVHDGETMVISGLVNPKAAQDASKLPFLGDIPVLGHLFKSTNFRSGNTDLVILVTPKIVTPASLANIQERSHGKVIQETFRKTLGKGLVD